MRTDSGSRLLRETTSLCDRCLSSVPAIIERTESTVWIKKVCPLHGRASFKISDDADYTQHCFGLSASMSSISARAGAVIIDLTDDCNFPCKTCIANSAPGGGRYVTLPFVKLCIEEAIAAQGEIPILMLSGGEPTIHPRFMEIVDLAYHYPAVRHVMVISNGVRFATEEHLAPLLASEFPALEVYLQYDSSDPAVLKEIRGADYSELRRDALLALESAELSTTLVSVVNKRVNLHDVGAVIGEALRRPNVRGVTFQPIRSTGRHGEFDYASDGTTLTDVRSAVLSQAIIFGTDGIQPHPSSPESIAIGYWSRSAARLVTEKIMSDTSSAGVPSLLPCVSDGDLFRVAIVCFYDRFNFCVHGVRRSLVRFATGVGQLVPLDTYYLFGGVPASEPVVILNSN